MTYIVTIRSYDFPSIVETLEASLDDLRYYRRSAFWEVLEVKEKP